MAKIRITLLSDTCISDGERYNSYIDTDICYDSYGLPYIPAKRIKGCLRETAMELNDMGEKINIDCLFGKTDSIIAGVSFGNGKLIDEADYMEDINKIMNTDSPSIIHEQNVLDHFTYIRTQTAINANGAAEDNSLRSIRVLKKGLVFIAKVECSKDNEQDLEKCCKVWRHVGYNRTRGLGEIKVSLITEAQACEKQKYEVHNRNPEIIEQEAVSNKNVTMKYWIELKSPVLFRGSGNGLIHNQDYIEGGKLLGYIAGQLGNIAYGQFMKKGNFQISNAYLSEDEERYTPIPASYYHDKDDFPDFIIKDRVHEDSQSDSAQVLPMAGGYMHSYEEGIKYLIPESEIKYHHSRSEDKGVGRTRLNENGAELYQLSALCKGQKFCGFLRGSHSQIMEVKQMMERKPYFRMGNNRTAEYGEVRITFDKNIEGPSVFHESKRFVLKCNAPLILYNDDGMYTTSIAEIKATVARKLKLDPQMIKVEKSFVNYTTIGGYNATWKMDKPWIQVVDKGSVFVFKTDIPVDIGILKNDFLGERTSQGFGECEAYDIPENYHQKVKKDLERKSGGSDLFKIDLEQMKSSLIKDILTRQVKIKIETIAINCTKEHEKSLQKKSSNAAIAKLLLVIKEHTHKQEILEEVEAWEDENKKDIAISWLNSMKDYKCKEPEEWTSIEKLYSKINMSEDDAYHCYIKAFMLQLKNLNESKKKQQGE